MRGVDRDAIAKADIVLSIVPPGDALALIQSLALVLLAVDRKPVYADCNGRQPADRGADRGRGGCHRGALRGTRAIIGGPPKPGTPGPLFYTAGPDAPALGRAGAARPSGQRPGGAGGGPRPG